MINLVNIKFIGTTWKILVLVLIPLVFRNLQVDFIVPRDFQIPATRSFLKEISSTLVIN